MPSESEETQPSKRFACVCCGMLTLENKPPGSFEICPVCWWEDDNLQAKDIDYAGGANRISLREARRNYARIGVSKPRLAAHARPPRESEIP